MTAMLRACCSLRALVALSEPLSAALSRSKRAEQPKCKLTRTRDRVVPELQLCLVAASSQNPTELYIPTPLSRTLQLPPFEAAVVQRYRVIDDIVATGKSKEPAQASEVGDATLSNLLT